MSRTCRKRDGRLTIGAEADLTLLRVLDEETVFADSEGAVLMGDRLLCPEMTVISGRIVYLQGRAGGLR